MSWPSSLISLTSDIMESKRLVSWSTPGRCQTYTNLQTSYKWSHGWEQYCIVPGNVRGFTQTCAHGQKLLKHATLPLWCQQSRFLRAHGDAPQCHDLIAGQETALPETELCCGATTTTHWIFRLYHFTDFTDKLAWTSYKTYKTLNIITSNSIQLAGMKDNLTLT